MVQHVSKKRRAAESLDGVAEGGAGDVARARPTWEDMVIAYSTIPGQWPLESTQQCNVTHIVLECPYMLPISSPGYASLRDHDKGTWFIQSLVEVFMVHAHDTELVDLLRMTR